MLRQPLVILELVGNGRRMRLTYSQLVYDIAHEQPTGNSGL